MDVVVKGHHCEVSDRFRQYVEEKLARIEKVDHRVLRCEVEVSQEKNPRQHDRAMRVELTMYTKGPVVRAEACGETKQAAFDVSLDRLRAQVRKAADRRRVHRGEHAPEGLRHLNAKQPVNGLAPEAEDSTEDEVPTQKIGSLTVTGDGPLVMREKTHTAKPMSLDQALYELELVGHDFYLFVDADENQPSVVYRRRGYDYGVIRLAV
ncbi:sigma 54 modulation protein/ribosomal protein S30EA [Kribbella flavida DSM 17836]|uniref:Ribosome hibernation promoting factor n=1 Tax=Kribbella flavida (strain DSM 17836 / JCM 10339 / NBRC 14399) TaxID=479435 RepID=D2PMI3_KRIFD|nr:ribosome-associated translation inhibitor RaiA [Kribbella flavida]ADB30727.1 sigma 54 modulation protein/ribosomal protein S30EA [Kribbella flavida DSM 17836]